MLAKINKLKNWQVALIIFILGFAVFSTGLRGQFQGDDIAQIVSNVPVHSIKNIRLLFEGGTVYNGQGLSPLSGIYYRPLMMTTFSVVYTIFGPHPIAFHFFQFLLCISSAFLLYLILKYSFKTVLALTLSLIFLVHPLNSQVVFAIPYMQDALLLFFGLLSFYLLLRFKSVRSLLAVALVLFLAFLSKESAVIFFVMAILYLFWFDRKRLLAFMGIMVVPVVIYLALKINAVGLSGRPNIAPIDNLNLGERLLNIPSIIFFYMSKFVFPWKLATGYYWVHTSISFRHFILPLIVDLAVAGLIIYFGRLVHRRLSKAQYYTYLFFTIWAIVGILPYLQIIPLEMTVCETWSYVAIIGALGMTGVVLGALHIDVKKILLVGAAILFLFAIRTAIRGTDYKNPYSLALKDISASREDYNAYNTISTELIDQGKYDEASQYAQYSVNIWPTYGNYTDLGLALAASGEYPKAVQAYDNALRYGQSIITIQNLAGLTLLYGNFAQNRDFILSELKQYPENFYLWLYLAVLEDQNNDNSDAKVAVSNAAKYGQVPRVIYNNIMNDKPFTLKPQFN
jgi:tetratricopeptide (TPR) repeat protein